MTPSGGLLGLLIAGLTASQQISPKEASSASDAANLQQLASSLDRHVLDWRLAAEAASTTVDIEADNAVGCATGTITVDTLTKIAVVRATASLARRLNLTAHGRESIDGERLSIEQEERSVAQLPSITTVSKDTIEQGATRTACVLVSKQSQT